NLDGRVLDDRYRIEKELGQGGVGVVYLARDLKLLDKPVVIKILLDRSLQNSWVVQKFQQEKEALARVDHPGVVGILDTGELADGKPYLVMQYIDGVTLRSQIKPEGMSLDRSAEIIKQIGRALGAAHDRGIFHRDLKPENIMLQNFGAGEEQVKIIDFGIAKLKDSIVAPSTMTGATAGTQFRSRAAISDRSRVRRCTRTCAYESNLNFNTERDAGRAHSSNATCHRCESGRETNRGSFVKDNCRALRARAGRHAQSSFV